MYYYEVQVVIPNENGYSFGVKSDVELDNDEVINVAKIEKRFEEDWDDEYVDSIEEISEEEFNEYFTN